MKTQGSNTDVVFLSGVRTGFGTFGGTLKDLSAIELGAVAASTRSSARASAGRGGPQHLRQRPRRTSPTRSTAPPHRLKAGCRSKSPPSREPAVRLGFEAITQAAR